jgi:hypothetical protein
VVSNYLRSPDGTGGHAWLVEKLEVLEVLQAEQENKQGSLTSSHKSGGLVLVLASGSSTCSKNARDLKTLFLIIV